METRRDVVLAVADRHHVSSIRWWPPSMTANWLDILVEELPSSLPAFRSELERALGCRVAVYVASRIPQEVWGRVLVETVAV
jgi:hypothetical protein